MPSKYVINVLFLVTVTMHVDMLKFTGFLVHTLLFTNFCIHVCAGHNQTAKDATHVPSSSSEQSHFNQAQPVSTSTALCKATQPTISGLQEGIY